MRIGISENFSGQNRTTEGGASMKYRCKLYRSFDYKQIDRHCIDSDPLRKFDDILDEEAAPFHDEISLEFLRETYHIYFSDDMHIVENEQQFAIHNLSESMKAGLMLLRNSQKGIYTDIEDLCETVIKYFRAFERFDLLFAYRAECGKAHPIVTCFSPLVVENYALNGTPVPVTITHRNEPDEKELVYRSRDWLRVYRTPQGYFSNGSFFTQFEYDWRRDLPHIKQYIENKYKDFRVFHTYECNSTLLDFCKQFNAHFDDYEGIGHYKVVSHISCIHQTEAVSRKVAQVFFIYMEDGSVILYKCNSVKYPTFDEVLYETYGFEKRMKYAYCLVIDVDEVISGTNDFGYAWFGFYIYKDGFELFDKDRALMEFAKQIPDVLKCMVVPVKGDGEMGRWGDGELEEEFRGERGKLKNIKLFL